MRHERAGRCRNMYIRNILVRRAALFLLFLCVALSSISWPAVYEADNSEFCEHHPEHTKECGYAEAAEGHPCEHEHGEDCYDIICVHEHDEECFAHDVLVCGHEHGEECYILQCGHEHDDSCYVYECVHEHDEECYEDDVLVCAHEHGEECRILQCAHEHDDACYVYECVHEHDGECIAPICVHEHDEECYEDDVLMCTHEHSEECRILQCAHEHDEECMILNCGHENGEHDGTCGYAEAVAAQPCRYYCRICAAASAANNSPLPRPMQTVILPFAATKGTDGHVADEGTLNDYINALALYQNSRYAGRIWSDKSVFTGGLNIDGTDFANNSDFLHVFSALGSSIKTDGRNQLPLDVVFIIDTSASMSAGGTLLSEASRGGYNNNERFHQTGLALNLAVEELMNSNPNNRFGLVEFHSTSRVVLPLDRYEPVNGKYFEPSTRNDGEDGPWYSRVNYYWRTIDITVKPKNGSPIIESMMPIDPVADSSIDGGMTNTQSGLYTGMNMLASVKDTKADVNGEAVQRLPVVIMLTDGQPTHYLTSGKWWTPNISDIGGRTGYGSSETYSGEGFLALATASYMKQEINRNYFGEDNSFGDTETNSAYETKVYTFGLELQRVDAGNDRDMARIVLAPGTYLARSTTMANQIHSIWNTYYNNTGVSLPNGYPYNYLPVTYNMTHPDTGYDITTDASATVALNYVDGAVELEKSEDLKNYLKDVLLNIIEYDPWVPVAGGNDVDIDEVDGDDYLTYIDPIGKYMSVHDVEALLLLGRAYRIAADGDEVDGIQKYKFVGVDTDALIWNISYGEEPDSLDEDMPGVFRLSEIEIYVKTTGDAIDPGVDHVESDDGFDQALYFRVPADALPVWVASFSQENGTNFVYDATCSVTPLRLVYTVGMAEEVLTNGKVDLTKMDADYLAANKTDDNAGVYFYSNWYADRDYSGYVLYDGLSSGEPVMSFSPANNNRYYIYQKSLRVYGPIEINDDAYKASPESFEFDVTNTHVVNGNTLTVNGRILNGAENIESDKWYYIVIDYYDAGGTVRLAVPRKGSMFGSGIGDGTPGACLSWYNPETVDEKPYTVTENDITTKQPSPGAGYFIATRTGCVRTGNMSRNVQSKMHPETVDPNVNSDGTVKDGKTRKTAGTYYIPTISSSTGVAAGSTVINNYMGNNGRLEVTDTQLLVTKTVDSDEDPLLTDDEPFMFTVKLTDNEGKPVYTDSFNAIKVVWEKEQKSWRALIDSIKLLTDSEGYLRISDADDGSGRARMTYNGADYYIFVGEINPTLFSCMGGKSLTEVFPTGAIKVAATLVPVDEAGENINDVSVTVGSIDMDREIAHEVSLNYSGSITYQLESVPFDESGTASFELTHGTGLLFTGLDLGTRYTVTETLTAEQTEEKVRTKDDVSSKFGWEFEYVKYQADDGDSEQVLVNEAEGYNGSKIYAFSGRTGASVGGRVNVTAKVHYYNTTNRPQVLPGLEIEKEVIGPVDPNKEFEFLIKLEQPEVDGDGEPTGKYINVPENEIFHAYIMPGTQSIDLYVGKDGMVYVIEKREADEEPEEGEVPVLKLLTLKAGQVCVIIDLPEEARYTITEAFGPSDNGAQYATTIKVDGSVPAKAESGSPWPPKNWTPENGPVMHNRTVTGILNTLEEGADSIPAVHVTYVNALLLEMPGAGAEVFAPLPLEIMGFILLLAAAALLFRGVKAKRKRV